MANGELTPSSSDGTNRPPSPPARELEERVAQLEALLANYDPVEILKRMVAELERERGTLVRNNPTRSLPTCPESNRQNESSAHISTMESGESSTSDPWALAEARGFLRTTRPKKRRTG